ncbi:hypothetical protein FIBSPDRAFT_945955 [Athelia psychrophila]|uniref:Uncharacterized protein n=1 Tax=Athelia psychrophila TaxID=1759441 RepID=A0A166THH0_9AGAM|nr:hypothetical protein FIBSPDRAFT_945955 [Fibularhizoctonia sp. CBS 109695]
MPAGVFMMYPSALFKHFNIDICDIDFVTMNGSLPTPENNPTDTVSWTLTSLRPFEPLTHLHWLVLDTTLLLYLSDADTEALVQWWHKVEHLELSELMSDLNCGHPDSTSRTTLVCLQSFAKWCTRLETLVLNLDVTAYPSDAP